MSSDPQESKRPSADKPIEEQVYDPRDLVIKHGYSAEQNPEEVLDNQAVIPQPLDEFRDQREDLRRD